MKYLSDLVRTAQTPYTFSVKHVSRAIDNDITNIGLPELIREYLYDVQEVYGCHAFYVDIVGNPRIFTGPCSIEWSKEGCIGEEWNNRFILAQEAFYNVYFDITDGKVYYSEPDYNDEGIFWRSQLLAESLDQFVSNLAKILDMLPNVEQLDLIPHAEVWNAWLELSSIGIE